MPVVSVVIPAYGHCGFIDEAIQSVLRQTFTDYEIVVVNDGSPDNTREVLQSYVDAGQIRYFEQQNSGQATARNRGAHESRGEFIAFLDDDDFWPAEKLEWQVEALREHERCPLIGGGAATVTETGDFLSEWCHGPLQMERNDLFRGPPFVSPGQTLLRRSAFMQVGGFDPQLWGTDDFDLYFRLAQLGRLRVEPRLSLYYRVHSGNASKQYERMLKNADAVFSKYAADMSRQNVRDSSRWLYAFLGAPATQRVRCAFCHGKFVEAAREARILGRFLRPCVRDVRLAYHLTRDLSPWPIREALKAMETRIRSTRSGKG